MYVYKPKVCAFTKSDDMQQLMLQSGFCEVLLSLEVGEVDFLSRKHFSVHSKGDQKGRPARSISGTQRADGFP